MKRGGCGGKRGAGVRAGAVVRVVPLRAEEPSLADPAVVRPCAAHGDAQRLRG